MADDRNYEFTLPDLGEGVMEGEVVKLLVQPGQEVKADEPLLQVMTDKATVEIPSPRKAKVVSLHVNEGDIIPVGTKMLTLELAPGETRPIAHHAPAAPAAPAAAPKAAAQPPRPASQAAPSRPAAPPAAARPATPAAPAAAREPAVAVAAPPATRSSREVLATPATRALARQMGVDIAEVQGTGPAGRVTREDLERLSQGAPAAAAGPREERIPLRGLRRRIAERMTQSAFSAPHVTHVDEVDMTALAALRLKAKPLAEARGAKLSYLPFIMKALVTTMREFPYFNAHFDAEANELVVKRYYNLGFAAATEQGLLVPVVKEAETKTIWQIASDIEHLARITREGKGTTDDLTGSTFTITNYGSVGGLWGTPIINQPEVAILGTGKTQQRPVVRDGQVVVREMMYLALSFDHRVIDGADAARFVNTLIRYLESPELLLLDM